ncbi:DHA2 family efflux MFS transporter permease subunit [Pediococcus ethanolidurans]|nr:DHA2 family efflux MFS transporter permease subunit [Pediococcus ethanolidurans]
MVIALVFGAFTTTLSETLLNNALPAIMRSFNIVQSQVQWLSTGYLLVVGIMIPISAALINNFKTKRLFIVTMLLFLVGNIISFSADSFAILLFGRLVQAVSVGIMMPFVTNLMTLIFPPEKRGSAMGITGIIVALAPAIGPTLSGYIVDTFSWHLLFGILIPIAALSVVLGAFGVKNVMKVSKNKVDLFSVITSTFGFGSLLYSFSNIGNTGSIDLVTTISFIIGLILIVVFMRRQLKIKIPLLNLQVFKSSVYTITTIIGGISNIALLGVELILPLYMQNVRGDTALVAGLVMLPGAIMMGIMNPIAGRLFDQYGGKKMGLISLAVLTITTIPFGFMTNRTSIVLIAILYAFRMMAVSFIMMPMSTMGINALPFKLITHGNAITTMSRQIAASMGTAILVSLINVVTNLKGNSANLQSGYHVAFLVTVIFSLIGLILTARIKEKSN